MNTAGRQSRRSVSRAVVCAALFAAGVWLGWYEPLLVKLILLTPAFVVWRLPIEPAARRQRLRTIALMLGLGIGIAVALHIAAVNMLEGYVRPAEVVWSAWFYGGFTLLIEAAYQAMAKLANRAGRPGVQSLIRLIAIIAVLPPIAAATIQTVRAKIGYRLPSDAAALAPVSFTTTAADGMPLHGYFFDRGHETTVIVAHGLGAHAENFMPYLTKVLQDHEVNGLIFDFRGHGYSAGHVSSFGYHEAADVLAAAAWLRTNHPQRSERLILYGFSMGSAAAIYAAPAPGMENLTGVIIDSGLARLTDVAAALTEKMPPGVGHMIYYGGIPLASALSQAPLWAVEPVEVMDQIAAPKRIVHGSDDLLIPVSQGRLLMERQGVTGRIIPGGQHTNLIFADSQYFNYIGRFIEVAAGGGELTTEAQRRRGDAEESKDQRAGPAFQAPP